MVRPKIAINLPTEEVNVNMLAAAAIATADRTRLPFTQKWNDEECTDEIQNNRVKPCCHSAGRQCSQSWGFAR
jgi:hypothetical protein